MEQFEIDNSTLTETSKKPKSKKKIELNKYIVSLLMITVFLLLALICFQFFHISTTKITTDKNQTFTDNKSTPLKEVSLAINAKTIKEIYSPTQAIEDCKHAFKIIAENSYQCPLRTFLQTKNQDFTVMPASVKENDSEDLAIKLLSIVPENRKRGLPLIPGKLLLYDEVTGFLKSIMDGGMVTNLRTGATAGATSSVLHKHKATNVVIFGCGAQGTYGLDSILTVHPEVKKVTCFDYFQEMAVKYAENHKKLNDGRTYIAGPPEELEKYVREADIIHCATTSKKELFKGEWVKDGTHISAIGCYTLEMRELPKDLFKKDNLNIYVDQYQAMKEEAGDIMAAINDGILDEKKIKLFGDIFTGKDKGRNNEKEITITKFVGVAPQDIVAARSIYKLAMEKNVGVKIEF